MAGKQQLGGKLLPMIWATEISATGFNPYSRQGFIIRDNLG